MPDLFEERTSDQVRHRICRQCHAYAVSGPETCPACGGVLLEDSRQSVEASAASIQVDRRGIALPPRHAVGGVITPR